MHRPSDHSTPSRVAGATWPALTLVLMLGCAASARDEGTTPHPEQTTLLAGDRSRTSSRKASENRPHPWEEEKGVFQADRLDLEPYVARRRAQHREEHSKQTMIVSSFSHPACNGVPAAARSRCPLLMVAWSESREVPGGMELEARVKAGLDAGRLHRIVLCHVAYGKVTAHSDSCPFHVKGVRSTVRPRARDTRMVLTITTTDPQRVDPLRERIKALLP